jgi:hypothetical protein
MMRIMGFLILSISFRRRERMIDTITPKSFAQKVLT